MVTLIYALLSIIVVHARYPTFTSCYCSVLSTQCLVQCGGIQYNDDGGGGGQLPPPVDRWTSHNNAWNGVVAHTEDIQNGIDLYAVIISNEKCALSSWPRLSWTSSGECIRCWLTYSDRFTIEPLLCINEDASLPQYRELRRHTQCEHG